MCNEETVKDDEKFLRERGLTRRSFNASATGAALSMMLPSVANAMDIVDEDVVVETPDGLADCYFIRPAEGSHAGVIIWPDIKGIRPSFRMMGRRLAESGYSTLVVNPYYRTAKGEVIEDGESFGDPVVREKLMPHALSLSPETCVSDGRAFVKYLDAQPAVDTSRKIGTTGYCMTGSYTMRMAADMPDRIGAGGSFHGGGLATDEDSSPHLLAPQIKAGLLIAIADNDDENDPNAKVLLRKAFDDAGVDAEVEVYEGALHGWCTTDADVYNEVQAERAWSRLLVLFAKELA